MKRIWKKSAAAVLTMFLGSALSVVPVSAEASSEIVIIGEGDHQMALEKGFFRYPSHTPVDKEQGYDSSTLGTEFSNWAGTYYGEGSGLELQIYSFEWPDGTHPVVGVLHDYSLGGQDPIEGDFIIANGFAGTQLTEVSENVLQCAEYTLTRENDSQIRMDLTPGVYPAQVYRNQTSILLTDIEITTANPQEDHWSGSYGYNGDRNGNVEEYVCIQQLYGTRDYAVYESFVYNDTAPDEPTPWMSWVYEDQGDMLTSFMSGPNEVTTENTYMVYGKADNGDLRAMDYPLGESYLSEVLSSDYFFTYITNQMLWSF